MAIENAWMERQIVNQIQVAENFKNTCLIASKKDDGKTSNEERKVLNKINKETDSYIKALKKLIQ